MKQTYIDSFTQGGQTQLHKLHMVKQVIGSTMKITLFLYLCVAGFLMYSKHTWHEFWALCVWMKASIRVNVFNVLPNKLFATSKIFYENGTSSMLSDFNIAIDFTPWAQNFIGSVQDDLIFSMWISVVFFVVCCAVWSQIGKRKAETKILKGFRLVDVKNMIKSVKKVGKSPYTISDVPFPKGAEFQHTIVTGTTGSGKSNMIHQLLEQIRQNGDEAIIVDSTGGLFSRFYDADKDILLNPLDDRSKQWNLFLDIKNDCFVEEVAETIISDTRSMDSFWISSARQVFCETLRYLRANELTTYQEMLDMATKIPLAELFKRLRKTLSAPLLDPTIDKTAMSIRATLANHLRVFQFLNDDSNDFSITSALKNTSNSWYFLSCETAQRALLRPIFSTWLSLMIKTIMTRKESNQTRTWIIIDELASLNKLPSLLTGLAEIRKYGGCFILGFQDLSQIESIYGHQEARTLSNLTANKVVFKMTDADVAAKVSRFFGDQEKEELKTSISYGAHTMRDGVNLNQHTQTKQIVSASDVMQLENLNAYVKFSILPLVTKVTFAYKSYDVKTSIQDDKDFTHMKDVYVVDGEEFKSNVVEYDFKNKIAIHDEAEERCEAIEVTPDATDAGF